MRPQIDPKKRLDQLKKNPDPKEFALKREQFSWEERKEVLQSFYSTE